MALDPERNYLFLGDGDTISILMPELLPIHHFRATESGLIGGLFYSTLDHLLYAACRGDGLKIFDVSEIENPVLIAAWFPQVYDDIQRKWVDVLETNHLCVEGSTAYFSCGVDDFVIADISDRTRPEMISHVNFIGANGLSYAMDVLVEGDYAYIADLYSGIHVINVRDPENPKDIKGILLAGASDLTVSGGCLYTVLQGGGTAIIDISDPETPEVTGLFTPGDVESAVRVDGDFAWIVYNTKGLRALDVSDKENPVHNPAWIFDGAGGGSLEKFSGVDEIYMADYETGLIQIDARNKADMKAVATFDTAADATAIDIAGDYLFAVDDGLGESPENEGLRILHLSTFSKAAQFELTGFRPTPGTARDVKAVRDHVYVADGLLGLQIISISDPEHPEIIASRDTRGDARGIFIEGSYAYIADTDGGLSIMDITNKSAPVQTAVLDTAEPVLDVAVSGDFAYLANGARGLLVVNISDKSQPAPVGSGDTPGSAAGVAVSGTYAYVADGSQGLAVMDITNPAAPRLLASLDTKGTARRIMVSGGYAYLADGENGLVAVDVSDPAAPVLVPEWSYDSPGTAADVFSGYSNEREELFVFLADGPAGVIAVNLSIDEIENPNDDGGGSSGGGGCFINTAKSDR